MRNTTGKILDVACVLIGKGIIEVLGKEKDWTTIGIQPDFVLVLVLNKRLINNRIMITFIALLLPVLPRFPFALVPTF